MIEIHSAYGPSLLLAMVMVVVTGAEGFSVTGGCDGAGISGDACGGFGRGACGGLGSGLRAGVLAPASPGSATDRRGVPELESPSPAACSLARWLRASCGAAALWASTPTPGAAGGADATSGDCSEESPPSVPENSSPRMISSGTRIAAIHAIRAITETVEGVNASRRIPPRACSQTRLPPGQASHCAAEPTRYRLRSTGTKRGT